MLLAACKLIFIVSLAAFFLRFFGYPSYVKYLKNQTFISEETVNFDLLKPPALTFMASRSKLFKGWKQNVDEDWVNLSQICNTTEDYEKVVKCMNDKTLKLSDFVKEAKSGDENSKDITDALYWTEDIGLFQAGKTFTLNNSYTVGADGPYMEILLKENYTNFILIHDPNFFVPTTNPITVPHVLLEDTDSKSLTVYIKAIYQNMMEKPDQRCEASKT